jgi:predicted HTH domain antitoxin
VYNAYLESVTEVTVSARIPREMEEEVEALMREEHLEKSAALRRLLHLGIENYRRERAVRLLFERKATLSKAAQVAKITIWEMLDLVRERGIVWVGDDVIDYVREVLRGR